MEYIAHLLVLVGIYGLVGLGVDLLLRYLGIVSVMQAVFFGLGAYGSALLMLRLDIPFPLAIAASGFVAAVAGYFCGAVLATLTGDYLALATFGFALICRDLFENLIQVTRGPMGLPGIPHVFAGVSAWIVLVGAVSGLLFCFFLLIVRSPTGRLLLCIRDDEDLVRTLGRRPSSFKRVIFAVSAFFCGVAGGLYASYMTFIDPSSFSPMESIMVLVMVIIGSFSGCYGGFVGSAILILVPEGLRFVGLPLSIAAGLREAFFGLLIAVVVHRGTSAARVLGSEP